MPKLSNALTQLLGTRLPIIQAPMAGGITTPALVAAAGNAGALGSFGFAYTQPEAMARDIEAVRALTKAPVNANFFVNAQPAPIDAATQRDAINAVAPYYAALGLPTPQPVKAPHAPDLDAQLNLIEDLKPEVLTFHLGDLPAVRLQRLREQGITDLRVLERVRVLPRHIFVDEALASRAYDDCALPIGFGQTISQPYIVARMSEIGRASCRERV